MERKNIYDLVKLNYNIYHEISKIHDILTHEHFFSCSRLESKQDEEKPIRNYLFFEFADKMLFEYLPDKGTCMSLMEFMNDANAILRFGENGNLSEARIINYLEVVENLLNIYFRRYATFKKRNGIDYYVGTYKKVVFLMDELEKYLRITKIIKKDTVILKSPQTDIK